MGSGPYGLTGWVPCITIVITHSNSKGVSMGKLIGGAIVICCVVAAGLICSGMLTEADASQAVSVESGSDPVPVSCNTLDLEKKCCPKYCKAPNLEKDKVFDKCAGSIGCDEYKGHGFSTCNSSCK